MHGLVVEAFFCDAGYLLQFILELAVPAWHSGLARQQSIDIERIKKIALKLILGDNYENYQQDKDSIYTDT